MESKANLSLGRLGEDEAVDFLKTNGYEIIARNYKTKAAEIDIVARDKDVYCFVEVKTRKDLRFGLPQEAVKVPKQNKISIAALTFLKEYKLFDRKARFDVVSIAYSEGAPKINLIKNAFELNSKFAY